MRAFGDVKSFFKIYKSTNNENSNYVNELLTYEGSLEKRFSFPLNAICAYEAKDISKLDKKQIGLLMSHHGLIHVNNYNELANPSPDSHIILLYEDRTDLEEAISEYINEGLNRNQLCIHASVYLRNDGYVKNFSSKIFDFDENVKKGNLILIDLTEYYLGAMTENLQYFDKLKDNITKMAIGNADRNNKHVRLTADCAILLLKNKHFEECINLENWWHTKPFEGSYVCPYPKYLLNQFPYNYYLFKLFHNHDIVIDTDKNISLDYVKNTEHQSKLISDITEKVP